MNGRSGLTTTSPRWRHTSPFMKLESFSPMPNFVAS